MINWKKLKNQIPSRVQITRNKYYEVVWVDSFPDGNTLGETRYNSKQIAIKKGLGNKLTVITYLHEVLHAVSGANDANLTEKQVEALEKSFYYLLKCDNIFRSE